MINYFKFVVVTIFVSVLIGLSVSWFFDSDPAGVAIAFTIIWVFLL